MDSQDNSNKLFVLDTNVLMHDPSALFRFDEHNIYLPMVVLEELDNHKTGLSEVARNVRQTNRFLVELMANVHHDALGDGVPIVSHISHDSDVHFGRIFFQTDQLSVDHIDSLPGNKADNSILATTLGLMQARPELDVILISKDINLRIKAAILGIQAQDYFNDRVLDNVDLLPSGLHELSREFWDNHGKDLKAWQEDGKTYYSLSGPDVEHWHPNDCISAVDDFNGIVASVDANVATVELARDFREGKKSVWGINARNQEQNFALNVLLNPEIDFVTLQGTAGTGKTLLTVAAGLHQVLDLNIYSEI